MGICISYGLSRLLPSCLAGACYILFIIVIMADALLHDLQVKLSLEFLKKREEGIAFVIRYVG